MFGGDIIDKIEFKYEINDKPETYAQLSYLTYPKTIDRSLIIVPKKITLSLKPSFFKLPSHMQKQVLLHEVGHIGYPFHNEQFRKLMKEIGGYTSLSEMLNLGYKVQIKEGSRYKTIKTFKTLEEARAFAKQHVDKYGKIRIVG